jgi:hypothetical protein
MTDLQRAAARRAEMVEYMRRLNEELDQEDITENDNDIAN